jgi:hypothetical protein
VETDVKPKTVFAERAKRSEHLLVLFDLLGDTRARNVREDWAAKFRDLMHWPKSEALVRVDGKDKSSTLVFKASVGIDRSHFAHDYLTELLRAAVVAGVSATDRYFHDVVVYHSWKLLSRKDEEVPKELRQLSIPALTTRRAVEKMKSKPRARPGLVVKMAIQESLHRRTFQDPNDVHWASQLLGVKDFWGEVAKRMPGSPSKGDVQATLRTIVRRRHQIVHEADLHRKVKTKVPTLRELTRAEAEKWVRWLRDFVQAADDAIEAAV